MSLNGNSEVHDDASIRLLNGDQLIAIERNNPL